MSIKPEFSLILAVYLVLVLFGIGYNHTVAWWERQKYIEGFTSLAVVLGVLMTLGGVAVVDWQSALLALGAFAATGTPMIVGSILRYVRARREAQDYERQAAGMGKPG
jgi:Kef-type K+ transport system membrane component KefB